MLVEFTLRESNVVALATVRLDAERPEQTRSEWTVVCAASIVSLGALSMRIVDSSWLGLDTNAA